jgi:hypothetical protein
VISTTTVKATYTGDGAVKTFSYPYTFLATSDLVVKTRIIATGVEVLYVLDTDYSVTATNDDFSDGATITTLSGTAIPATLQLIVERNVPQTQSVDYPQANVFPAVATEDAFDKLTLIVQQLSRKIDDCLRVPDTDTQPSRLGNSVDRKAKYLTFDATTGQPITTITVAGESTPSASNPIITSGAGAPGSAPGKIGDVYIDTTGDVPYIGVDTVASTDFKNLFDMIADTTPQLGGALDANTKAITGVTTIDTSGGYKIATNLVLDYDSTNNNLFLGENVATSIAGATNCTGLGDSVLNALTTGVDNTAAGANALLVVTTGARSSAFGESALTALNTGQLMSAFGNDCLASATTAQACCGFGQGAMFALISANNNCAFGNNSLRAITITTDNSAFGNVALNVSTGSKNASFGASSLELIVAGNQNCAFGAQAAEAMTNGSKNLIMGYNGEFPSNTGSNQLNIGNVIWGSGASGTGTTATGQISVGINAPATDAILELSSTTKAFVPTRMNTTEQTAMTDAGNLVAGMIIFNTSNDRLEYVNNSLAWAAI